MPTGNENSPSALTRRNIVCFSTADWDTLLPTNKHHLMRRLAARNNRVLYIETLGTRAPRLGSGTDIFRIQRRLARVYEGIRKREKRLWSLSPLVRPSWKTPAQIALNKAAFRLQIKPVLAHFPDPIAWVYTPYACHLLDMVQPGLVVYHMVDDLGAVPGADKETIREAEARILARADIVFCSERSLHDRARLVSANCHFLPNVADYHHFSRPRDNRQDPRLANLRALPRPRILFSGNLAPHKVDLELIHHIARERPDWQIILIGPVWEGAGTARLLARLRARHNVTLTGHVEYDDLPPYIHAADVLLIPYVLNDATRAVFPLKLFEYLATGRPVVAAPLPSLLPYKGAIRIACTPAQWLDEIHGALHDTHEMEQQRRALARRHTWDSRLGEMEGLISGR